MADSNVTVLSSDDEFFNFALNTSGDNAFNHYHASMHVGLDCCCVKSHWKQCALTVATSLGTAEINLEIMHDTSSRAMQEKSS